MPKLTIIVGMGGSGKSMLCDQIATNDNATAFKDATLTKDDHRRAGHECLGELVARLLGSQENCVMDEAHLVNAHFRSEFKSFCDKFLRDVEQEWIFFAYDVVGCINNVFYDWENGRKEPSRLRSLANQIKEYKVPPAGEFPGHKDPRPVPRQQSPRFKDCEEAAARIWLCENGC